MMKRLFYILLAVVAVALTSCKGKQPDTGGVYTTVIPEGGYTDADDTLRAVAAVSRFINLVQAGRVDEAIGQLHLLPSDPWGRPDELALEDKERFEQTLGLFPIYDFSVDSMAFRRVYDNDVWVTLRLAGPDGGPSKNHMQLHFCPVYYQTDWMLTLKDNVD